MATNWQLSGTNQLIAVVKQSGGAIENIDFNVNTSEPCSLLGGYIEVIGAAGGSTCDILIGPSGARVSCLKTTQATTAAGMFALDLNATATNLNIDADDQIRIAVAGGAAQVQVTLFISQASPATLA